MNRFLETYLICLSGEKPKEWSPWLPLAEWWRTTHFHLALKITPYEVVYHQPPPLHLTYVPRESTIEAVDRSMIRRENIASYNEVPFNYLNQE